MGKRKFALVLSASLLLMALLSLGFKGLNMGLDLTGGSLLEIGFSEEIDPEEVRSYLEGAGFNNGTVQYFGTNRDLLIRMPPQPGATRKIKPGLLRWARKSCRKDFPGASLSPVWKYGKHPGLSKTDSGWS